MADLASTEPGAMAMTADETSPPKESSPQGHQVADDSTGDHAENLASPHDQITLSLGNVNQHTMNLGPQHVGAEGHIEQCDPAKNPTSTHEEPVMNEDPTAVSQSDLSQPEPRDESEILSDLCSETSLDVLEASAKVGVTLLKDLREPIAGLGTETGQEYLNSVDKLSQSVKKTRFVVGVVGNTGAGKSSVINAILDEERLLPTNCLRACTASPTEISYNHSEDPTERYRAEVEFISADSWIKELEILYGDMLDGGGNITNTLDNEAKVALEKLRAVYPGKSRADLAECQPKDLAWDHSAVRIFTKASALETGTVLVDLPGVQDSNAARAAVAERYMKECSALFILAPITRAVDDKTARKLLGKAFCRQLKFDGAYSAITFVCSKTDDISVSEAVESLQLREEVAELSNRRDEIEVELRATNDTVGIKTRDRDDISGKLDELNDELDRWDGMAQQSSLGSKVYPPTSRKRKRLENPSGARKNLDSSDGDDEDSGSDTENGSEEPEKSEPLDGAQIAEKVSNLKLQSRELRTSKKRLAHEINELSISINCLTANQSNFDMEVAARCIRGRNEYARDAIQLDFARGIQEMDQDAMAEEDEESFDPGLQGKDYEALGKALPVFCVSARAYQYLCGRLKKDRKLKVRGFADKEATEIPRLQQYTRTLSSAARASQCRRFLSDLEQIINSMRIWTAPLPVGQMGKEAQDIQDLLDREMQQLLHAFLVAVQECVDSIDDMFSKRIVKCFEKKMPAAVSSAVEKAQTWGAAKDEGGMRFGTYQATARRSGVFRGAAGSKNFNLDLLHPIMGPLAPIWERAFTSQVPGLLVKFAYDAQAGVREFHDRMCQESGIPPDGETNALLNKQLRLYIRGIASAPETVGEYITQAQREVSRSVEPVITEKMDPAYKACVAERGPGMFLRMKQLMKDHVGSAQDEMFKEASKTLAKKLKELVGMIDRKLKRGVKETLIMVCRDYKSVLLENRAETLSEVANILSGANARFTQSTLTNSALELEPDSIARDELKGGKDGSGDITIKMELTE
ncbi:hypothetical protein RB593_008447 [Gaeumannomyces tritici]